MSLLLFTLDDDGITIVTDTLLTDPGGEPQGHIDKVTTFPRMVMATAITGHIALSTRWGWLVRNLMHVSDIADLDRHAQPLLQGLHDQLLEEIPAESAKQSSTIYHFGWDHAAERWAIYVYRSTTGFAGERIDQPCIAVKPHPADVDVLEGMPTALDGLVDLAASIRSEQLELPHSERVHVGGQLIATQLVTTAAGPAVHSTTVHDFDRPRSETFASGGVSRPPEPRWSYSELDAFLVHEGYTLRWQKINALGIPGKHPERTWWRWRRDGVPDRAADEVAIRLGTHPTLIWGADWSSAGREEGLTPAER